MVDRSVVAGAEHAIPSLPARAGESAAAAGDPVSGLCSMAAGMAEWGAVGASDWVLAGSTGGRAGAAGVADGSSTAGAAGLQRCAGAAGVGWGADAELEAVEPAARCDVVHDGAGGLVGSTVAFVVAGRGGDWDAGCQSRACGDGRTDRVLRQHAGVAHQAGRVAERERAVVACAHGVLGGPGPSGPAVRAGGGDRAAAAPFESHTDLPGAVQLAQQRGQPAGLSGGAGKRSCDRL